MGASGPGALWLRRDRQRLGRTSETRAATNQLATAACLHSDGAALSPDATRLVPWVGLLYALDSDELAARQEHSLPEGESKATSGSATAFS